MKLQYIESFVLFDEVESQATTMTAQLRENQVGTSKTWHDPANPNPVAYTESDIAYVEVLVRCRLCFHRWTTSFPRHRG